MYAVSVYVHLYTAILYSLLPRCLLVVDRCIRAAISAPNLP